MQGRKFFASVRKGGGVPKSGKLQEFFCFRFRLYSFIGFLPRRNFAGKTYAESIEDLKAIAQSIGTWDYREGWLRFMSVIYLVCFDIKRI